MGAGVNLIPTVMFTCPKLVKQQVRLLILLFSSNANSDFGVELIECRCTWKERPSYLDYFPKGQVRAQDVPNGNDICIVHAIDRFTLAFRQDAVIR